MSFSADIAAFANKAGESLDKTVRMVTLELFGSVIRMTPVGNPSLWQNPPLSGYVGGRARGNWQTTVGSPAGGELGIRSESAAIAELEQNCGKVGTVTYMANNLPYIKRLEEGWSTQSPPYAMVRANFTRIESIVANAARQNKV